MTSAPEQQRRVREGLSEEHARRLLEEHGPNAVPEPAPARTWRRVVVAVRDPLVLVLLAAAVATLATGDTTDSFIIATVISVNTAVGVAQQRRADQAVAALARLAAPEAQVVRDGRVRVLAAAELVPGDVVLLTEGAVVPADGVVHEAERLLVDESSLTGEAEPVEKDTVTPERAEVTSGTVVVRGRGAMTVTLTGAESRLGQIVGLVAGTPAATPLQRRLADLGRTLAILAGALSLVVFVVGVASGQGVELMAVTAISLVVAAVPESLPAVVTLALALGARRMAQRNAIIRHLSAVEALGSVTVVGTDKTGTLTRGDMEATRAWTADGSFVLPAQDARPLERLLRAAALCNDARTTAGGGRPVGDPTEAALLEAAETAGWSGRRLATAAPRIAELPFDSDRRCMTTVHRLAPGRLLVVSKGAPEALLSGDFLATDDAERGRLLDAARSLADQGHRVLAFASREIDALPQPVSLVEHGLEPLGLLGLRDPVRESAASTIAAFRAAGVTPILISGDNEGTVRAVAAQTGIDLDGDRPTVYPRAAPEDKLRIIADLQARGEIVAMTGDGVNDAPALRQADIGVAMGRRGTEAARQAADLVLADDELGTLIAAVEEGRRVYDNIRRFLLFALAGGTAEIALMLAGPLAGMPVPLLPGQILWVNLLTHGLPGVAMGAEPSEPDVLRRPPRPPSESVLGGGLWQRVGALATLVTLTSLVLALAVGGGTTRERTLLFTILAVTQFGVAAGVRSRGRRGRSLFLPVAIAGAWLLQLAAVYLAPLQDLFETTALPAEQLLLAVGTSVVAYGATRALTRPSLRPPRGPAD